LTAYLPRKASCGRALEGIAEGWTASEEVFLHFREEFERGLVRHLALAKA
jgi:hypothetical protein